LRLLDLKGIHLFSEKSNLILRNLDFYIEQGEVHAIVGASGSGKSSLGYLIMGLIADNLQLEYDQFQILGKDWKEVSSQEWTDWRGHDLYLIPQNPVHAFHPFLSLGNQIEDFLKAKNLRISLDCIIETFESIGIRDARKKWNSKPEEISGGERQRILIGLSLFTKPKILIADEPTTALDAYNEKLTLKTLSMVMREHRTALILISHDKRIVKEFADRVTVLKMGEMMENFQVIKGNWPIFQNEYTKKLLKD
jgi:peptide/nickel transport system ATP-binding protein